MIYPEIPLPRLIDKNGQTERYIRPISVDINQKIVPLSYASMTLPQDESVPGRSYVELFTSTGSAGIYRVTSPQEAFGEDLISCELEHAITEVGDWLYDGELSEMIPANEAIGRIFNTKYKGNKWQLGSTSALGSTKVAVEISYRNVLEGILGVLDQVSDCMMTFDFSTTPWTFGFAKKGTTVQAEGRLSRNVTSAKITYDDSSLCTRAFYQYTDGTESHWATKNSDTQSEYGIVERSVSTGSGYTKAEAEYVVNRYLEKHKKPLISISIEGLELSSITGEPLDRFEIGKMFRLALPDYGISSVEDIITELSWKGLYSGFEQVTVNLGDQEDGVVNFLHDMDSSGGSSSGGRAGSSRSKQNTDFWTAINRTDYAIKLEAYERVKYDDWNYSYIDITACYIRQEVGQTANGIYSRITQTANTISQEVASKTSKASLILSITGGKSSAKLSADVIDIDGVVTSLQAMDVMVANFNANNGEFTGDLNVLGDTTVLDLEANTIDCSGINIDGDEVKVVNASVDGNTLKIWKVGDQPNAPSITFSKAITRWTSSWRNGVFTGTAHPQNQSVTTTLADTYSVSGNPVQCDVTGRASSTGKYMKQNIVVQYEDGEDALSTGQVLSVVVDATDVFTYGQSSSSHSIDIPSTQIYTTGNNPQGTKLTTLRNQYEQARSDSEYVCFRVDCGGTTKWYYMEP